MRSSLKRALAGVAALAVAAGVAPFIAVTAASAAGVLDPTPADVRTAGGGAPLASGDSATTFTLRLPAGAACPGDAAAGYQWQTYMVPSSVDPSTLTFDLNGPIPTGVGASFRQPLYDSTFSPITNKSPAAATPPAVTGPIINIPDMIFTVYSPGDVLAGVYNIGIACTQGAPSATQMKNFWNTQLTVTTPGGGPASFNWSVGAPPAAPTAVSATGANESCVVSFTAGASIPPATFQATANPGGFTSPSGSGSPLTISGLTNGTAYNVTVTATNPAGSATSSPSVPCTPVAGPRTNVTGVSVTPGAPGSGLATVNWTAPAANTPPATPTGYQVVVAGPTPSTQTALFPAVSLALSLLAPGTYTATVTAQYADAPTSGTVPASSAVGFTVAGSGLPGNLLQDITVVRPTGALVLTQVCGVRGTAPLVAAGSYVGFPSVLPADAGLNSSTVNAPTSGGSTPTPDTAARRAQYPYPTDADGVPDVLYPTHCGLDLGIARLVTTGPGSGQFFATNGFLNQVSVVDTRDDTPVFTITGTMSAFTANAGADTFSGSQLGWIPKMTEDTGLFTDSDGNTYDQVVVAGGPVAPNSPNATGLSAGRTLAQAPATVCTTIGAGPAQACTGSLGTAILDARLLLLIPITADAGTYTGTLTITAT